MATHSALVKAKRSANGYEGRIIDPQNMKVLVVDSKSSSRQLVSTLLRDCLYQVTSLKTSKEALQLLGEDSLSYDAPFDLILKEHEPPSSNACKLLRKLARNEQLCRIPVVVMSSQDDRDVVAKCLSLGATDFLVKPLRHNELRNIWTRIWWWRKATAGLYHAKQMGLSLAEDMEYETSAPSSSDSEDTKCEEEEEEPTSKEGSAPDGNGHGSNGVNGSNGSKEGNGTSRVETKVRDTGKSNNANGSSDDKNGNGNSATKDRHNGSNGNGASTTLVPERPGSCALVGTAEGKAKPFGDLDHQQPKAQAHRGGFDAYPGGPLLVAHAPSSSRKRPAYLELQGLEQESHRSRVPKHHHHHQEAVGDVAMYDPDQQSNGHTPRHVYESEQRSNGHTLPIPQDGEQQSNTPNRERDQERGSNDPAQPLCDTEQQSNGHTLLRTPYQDQDQEQRSNGHTCAPEGGQSLGQTNSSQGLLMRLFTSHVPSNTSNPEGKTSEQMVAVPGASVGSLGANRFGRADSRGGACYSGPHSAFVQYTAGSAPPPRKRSASDVVAAISGVKEGDADSDQLLRSRSNLRDRTTARTTNNASSNPSTHNTVSEDTIHPVNKQSSFLPGHHSAHAGTLFGPHPPSHSMSPWVQPGAHASTLQAQAVQVAQAAAAVAAAQTSAQATHPGYPTLFPPPYGHLLPPQMLPLALYGANAGGPQGPPVRPTDPLSAFQQLNNFNKVAADHLLAAATAEAARTRGHHPGVGVDGLAGTSQLNMLVGSLLSSLWSHALNTQQMQQQVPPGPQHPLPSTLKPQPQPNGAAWGQNQMRSTFPPAYLNQNGQLQLPVSAPDSSMASGYGQSTPPTNGGANNGAGTPPVENGHLARVNAGGGFVEERHGRRALALDKYRKKRKNLKFSKIIRYESRKQLAQQRPRIKGQFVKHVMKDVPAGEGLAVAADGEVYWEEVEGGVLRKTVLPYGAEYEDEEYDQDMEDDEMDEEDEDEDMLEDDDQRTPEEKETPLEEELEVAKSLHQLREAPPRTETEVVATGAHKGPSSGGHKSEENEARGVIWPSGPAGVPGSHGEGRDFTRGLQYRGSHLRAHHSGLQTHHRPRSSHQAPPNDAHVTGCSEGPQAAQLTVSGSNHETPTGGNPTGTPKNGSDSGSSNSPEDKTRLGKHRPS